MTNKEIEALRNIVINQVDKILLDSTFMDKIDANAKISDLTVFGSSDIQLIKAGIARKFKLSINQDITNFSVEKLHNMIFLHVLDSEYLVKQFMGTNKRKNKIQIIQPIQEDKFKNEKTSNGTIWNRKTIFNHIIKEIGKVSGRTVQSKEKLGDIVRELQDSGKNDIAFTNKLKELEEFFNIKIDLSMKLYNIGNAAEESFIAQGRAPDSKLEREEMDPYWVLLYDALSFKYVADMINSKFGVNVSTYKLCHTKSYEEYVKLIQDAQKRKADRLQAQDRK